jgi:hypothetical protein
VPVEEIKEDEEERKMKIGGENQFVLRTRNKRETETEGERERGGLCAKGKGRLSLTC